MYRSAANYGLQQLNEAGGWNGEAIQIAEYDNQGGPAGASDKVKAAIADGARIIIQGSSSAVSGQITEDVRKYNIDRKSVGEGKSVSVRVDIGGRRLNKKKKKHKKISNRAK